MIAKKQASKRARKKAAGLAFQSMDHRLAYLNPKERARRDLESRHGQNMVQLNQISADRLNSTLETQMLNLGVSIDKSNPLSNLSPIKKTDTLTNIKSMAAILPPRPYDTLKKGQTSK